MECLLIFKVCCAGILTQMSLQTIEVKHQWNNLMMTPQLPQTCSKTRRFLTGLLMVLPLLAPLNSSAADDSILANLPSGSIVVFRHALAPGGGDPPGFQLGNCATQRNLDDEGRAQAKRLGERFRANKVDVRAVLASQWCRTTDTATLAFGKDVVKAEPLFNSFLSQTKDRAAAQTAGALALLKNWRGPGVLVVVTHQVNITSLTEVYPQSGEGVVLQPGPKGLTVLGRVSP
jgi:phosphohistidine phosphatase SixA